MAQANSRAEIWTFASGRVAALEGSLLGGDALQRLAEADSAQAVAGALSDSPLRSVVGEAETPASAATAIASYYSGCLNSLEKDCPFPEMFRLVALPARYGALKERVRSNLDRIGNGDFPSEEIPELLGDFTAESEAARGLALFINVMNEGEGPSAELGMDLALDSARLLESLRLASSLGDAEVHRHVRDEATVRAALLLWRSKLLIGDDGKAPSALWIPRLFLRGELGAGLAAQLWKVPLPDWQNLLKNGLADVLGGENYGNGEEAMLNHWEKLAFDWLTLRARELRSQTFGVGRVYGYAWGLAVEERNVRLAMVGRLRGVSGKAIKDLLWESYS